MKISYIFWLQLKCIWRKNQGMLRCKNKPKCQIAWLNVWHELRLSLNEASTGNVFCEDVVEHCWFVVRDRSTEKIKLIENENYDRKSVRMVSKNNYSKRNHNTHLSMHNNLVWLYQHLKLVHYLQTKMIFKRKIWINRNWFCLGKLTQWGGQDEYKLCSLLITFFGVKCKNKKYTYDSTNVQTLRII